MIVFVAIPLVLLVGWRCYRKRQKRLHDERKEQRRLKRQIAAMNQVRNSQINPVPDYSQSDARQPRRVGSQRNDTARTAIPIPRTSRRGTSRSEPGPAIPKHVQNRQDNHAAMSGANPDQGKSGTRQEDRSPADAPESSTTPPEEGDSGPRRTKKVEFTPSTVSGSHRPRSEWKRPKENRERPDEIQEEEE